MSQQNNLTTAAAPAVAFDPLSFPRRLNLGCGFDYRTGFLNIDVNAFHKPDLVADVRHLTQLPSDFYEEVVAEDVLEHLGRTETLPALLEWSRLLRIGAVLRLRVPDLKGLLTMVTDPARQSIEEQEGLVRSLFGTQNYTGDYHQTGFTRVLLTHYLHQAGFAEVRISQRDGWLLEAQAIKVRNPELSAFPPQADLPESAYRVEWIAAEVSGRPEPGASFQCRLRVRNAGESVWTTTTVFPAYHWLDGRKVIVWDGVRTPLTSDVHPGDIADLLVDVHAPDRSGSFLLEFDLVHENVAWFEQRGAPTTRIAVQVGQDGLPSSGKRR